jgi:peptidyl-prolyl cis-trans isomerase B (cyclophilin B)
MAPLYRLLLGLFIALGPLASQAEGPSPAGDSKMTVQMQTNHGTIVLELDAARAPKTVENFIQYAKDGFYDGTVFHRVIPGFMIQGGGFEVGMNQKPTRDPVKNEADNGLKNETGTIAMARTNDPHSATAQFFINVKDNGFLNHSSPSPQGWGYCVFGRVTEGMDVVHAIEKVATGNKGFHQDVPVTRCDHREGHRRRRLIPARRGADTAPPLTAAMKPVLFISDLHLDPSRPRVSDLFLDFLAGEARAAAALYILGDLFEAWIGDDDPEPEHARVIAGLRATVDSGVPIFLMHGNRDFLLGECIRQTQRRRNCCRTAPSSSCSARPPCCCTATPCVPMTGPTRTSAPWCAMHAGKRDFLARPIHERQAIARQLRETSQRATRGKA